MGDRFAEAAHRDHPPGIIGPFSLQSVITKDLEMVVYDVSLRVPGNPILATTTPYTKYQYGATFGVGRPHSDGGCARPPSTRAGWQRWLPERLVPRRTARPAQGGRRLHPQNPCPGRPHAPKTPFAFRRDEYTPTSYTHRGTGRGRTRAERTSGCIILRKIPHRSVNDTAAAMAGAGGAPGAPLGRSGDRIPGRSGPGIDGARVQEAQVRLHV